MPVHHYNKTYKNHPVNYKNEKCKFTVFKVMFDFDYPSPLLYIQLEIVSRVPVVRFVW